MFRVVKTISRVWELRPVYAALIAMVFGGALLPVSVVAGVGFVTDTTGVEPRQVGFINAFNWSFVYGVLFPLYVLLQFSFLAEMRRLIARLGRWGMIVDSAGRPVTDQAVQESWQRMVQWATLGGLCLAALLIIVMFRGLYYKHYVPLFRYGDLDVLRDAMPRRNLDWGIAALLKEGVSPKANLLFVFYAVTVETAAAVFFTHLAWFSLAFAALLEKHSRPTASARIVPNVRMLDDRMGLQVFGKTINYLVLLFTAVFGVTMAIRLWQQYLHSGLRSSPVFLRSEIAEYLWPESLNGIPEVIPNMFYTGSAEGFAETATLVVALCCGIVTISFSLLMIPLAIHRGRRFMARRLVEEASFQSEINPETLTHHVRRLENLPDWPVARPSRNQLFAFMVFLVITLIFYRIIFLIVAVVFLLLLKNVISLIDAYISAGEK